MKKWKLLLVPVVLVAALALGFFYLRFMDEADPTGRPAAPLVWAAEAMEHFGKDSEWSRSTLARARSMQPKP